MKKTAISLVLSIAAAVAAQAQTVLPLWENTPFDNGADNYAELTVYHPEDMGAPNTGAAVVVCPGGGYSMLAMDHEGRRVAAWLALNGVTGVVVKYRMPNGNHLIPATDAREAMRVVRANAGKWGVDPKKVGIAGSSAGGHLASTVCTHMTDSLSHPDFAILFYPVITADPAMTHFWSIKNLLGDKSEDPAMLLEYSNEKQVSPSTPPTLLLLSDDDTTVNPLNSTLYYNALKQNGVPAAMQLYPIGGHGWGFHDTFEFSDDVKAAILDWIGRTALSDKK